MKKPLEDYRAFINDQFYVEASMINSVVGAASEAEAAAAFKNARQGISHRMTMMELKHPQQQVPLDTDATSHGTLTNTLMPKRSKEIDMRFFMVMRQVKSKII